MMTSLIWWAKCCHPYLWLQFPILISALNVWLSISIFKIKIDKLASQNQNSIFKIMLWVVNIKIQIQDSKVAYQDWYSTSTFASLLGNIQYQNQNRSRHQIQHQFQEYCQYQHQNQPISIILPTSGMCLFIHFVDLRIQTSRNIHSKMETTKNMSDVKSSCGLINLCKGIKVTFNILPPKWS